MKPLKEGLSINRQQQILLPSSDPRVWMTRREISDIPQLTDLYKERLQIIGLPFAIESIMKGVVSEILEDKLNQKFKPIENRLATIEESIKEFAPIRKIVVLETVTKEEAKEKIKELIGQTDIEFYPDEIAEKLCIDFQLVMEIINELIDEGKIEVSE